LKTLDIKQFVTNYQNAFTSHNNLFIMQPKMSMVEIAIPDAESFFVTFGKLSGNGFLVHNSTQVQIHQADTKIFCQGSAAKFERYSNSIGDICIKELEANMISLNINFSEQLEKAKKYTGLKLIKNELFASIDSEITGNVLEITTNPNLYYVRTMDGIKFTGSCKIVNLKIVRSVERNTHSFIHKILDKCQTEKIVNNDTNTLPIKKMDGKLRAGTVIYDSLDSGFNPAYCARRCEIETSSLVLDNQGSYTIPLKSLPVNRSYSVELEAERVNGNGKFLYGFIPDASSFALKIATNKSTYTNSVMVREGKEYSVGVWRHDSSSGKIRIYRLKITAGEEEYPTFPIIPPLQQPVSSFVDNKILFKNSENATDSSILKVFRACSVVSAQTYPTALDCQYQNNINFSLNTFDSRMWFACNKPTLPNSTYSSLMPIRNAQENKHPANVTTCNIDTVPNAAALYIEPFNDKNIITSNSLENIKKAQKIITPSFTNSMVLNQYNGNVIVGYLPLMIPYYESLQKKNQVFCVVDEEYLFSLYDCWKPENGILKVLDPALSYSMNYKGFVEPVSIYDSYPNIIKEFLQSKYLIYANGENSHHINKWIELANLFGIPVATNNTKYISSAVSIFRNDTNNGSISFSFQANSIPEDLIIPVDLYYSKCFQEFHTALNKVVAA
jgi:hypothetical protein